MKEGWKYKRLGDVATYINGFAFKPQDWCKTGIPIIRIQNLTNENSEFNYTNKDNIPVKYKVHYGDILISWSATLGVFEWTKNEAWLNQHIFKVIFEKENIDKTYFKYAVTSRIDEMSRHTNGATMHHIRKGDFDNIKIPICALTEQQAIVARIDTQFAKLDQLKANAEKQYTEAKELYQKALEESLSPKEGWKENKLGELVKFSQGVQVDVNLQSIEKREGWVRFLRIIDFTQGKEAPRYIKDPGEKYYLHKDEIAMVRYGTVGFVCYGFEGIIANNLFKINITRPKCITSVFLQYYLKSNLFQKFIHRGIGGAALPAIKFGDIKNFNIDYPSLEIQQQIVNKLDQISDKVHQLEENFKTIATYCDDMKQQILKETFE